MNARRMIVVVVAVALVATLEVLPTRAHRVLARRLADPLIKDTVDLPQMGSVDLEIAAYNPGKWFFHNDILGSLK